MKEKHKKILLLLGFFAVAVVLWDTMFIYPVKLFVVLLHEMSHGLMAELFGGDIVKIQVSAQVGGYCQYTIPPGWTSSFFIASAGYLGSMFWGGVILLAADKMKRDRIITLIIGIVMLILGYYVIKTGEWFGILFTLGLAVFMILSFFFIKDKYHDYMLKFLALVSLLYAVLDIKSDLIDRSGIGSDADKIAELTGIPSVVVGIFWIVIAALMLFLFLRKTLKSEDERKKEDDEKKVKEQISFGEYY
jgi:hypothetical protein